MNDSPFAPWPSFTPEEAETVSRVLLSNRVNYWTGQEGRQFEREFAAWTETRHAVALSNGTVALEAALHGLGIGPGDEVVVTPRTFQASASAIARTGAKPVFADVDRDSQNITADTVARVVTQATRAILCVHHAGWPCEMNEMCAFADANGLAVVEDCAQAHAATYRGRPVGGWGDVGAWSFCQDKIMTTGGEGGAVTTNDEALWSRIWSYKDHGKSWDGVHRREHQNGFPWVHESIGTNGRLTEMQAAIGRLQLGFLPGWSAARSRNAESILSSCESCSALRVPRPPKHVTHAWYKCYVFIRPSALEASWTRDRIMVEINSRGVPCFAGSCPEVYLEKAFRDLGLSSVDRLPVARELGETSLMFLVHPTLSDRDLETTVETVRDVMHCATRATHVSDHNSRTVASTT